MTHEGWKNLAHSAKNSQLYSFLHTVRKMCNLKSSVIKINYYVYILSNQTNVVLYTGITNNLIKRTYEHKNNLSPSSFTAKYKVHKLVYYETTNDVYSAISREKQIKSHSRKWKNELITSFNPSWKDLYLSLF